MTEPVSIKIQVDTALLDKVEAECNAILWQQRQRYNRRWYQSRHFAVTTSVLRLAGLVASGAGIALSVFYLVYPGFCPRWFYSSLFLVLFFVAGVFFVFMPRFQARVVNGMLEAGRPGCRRMARRFVSRARKAAPYNTEYSFRGDLISCFREKDGQHKLAWSRRMRGYAILGQYVALVFRKSTSLIPTMLILYENPGVLSTTLGDLGVEFEQI